MFKTTYRENIEDLVGKLMQKQKLAKFGFSVVELDRGKSEKYAIVVIYRNRCKATMSIDLYGEGPSIVNLNVSGHAGEVEHDLKEIFTGAQSILDFLRKHAIVKDVP
jgi:hypothetical protein